MKKIHEMVKHKGLNGNYSKSTNEIVACSSVKYDALKKNRLAVNCRCLCLMVVKLDGDASK